MAAYGSIAEELLNKINKYPYTTLPLQLPTSIFELFGNYCDESAYDVRRLLVKWLETRANEYAEYFSIPLRHKNLTMDGWLMQINDDTQPGDELCTYALARMFNRHVFIYTKHGYWSTHVLNIRAAEADVRMKCDITLVYVEPLVFCEIKKIKKPIKLPVSINLDTSLKPSTKPEEPETTEVKNFERKRLLDKFGKTRKRTDRSDPMKTTRTTLPPLPKRSIIITKGSDTDTPAHSYTLRTCKRQEVVRCNQRPARSTCINVNYSNMDNSTERTSPPRKRKKTNLMRYPSTTVITAHKRMKKKFKRTGKPMKVSTEVDPSTETDDKTISDNKSTVTSINNNNKETPSTDNTKSNNPGSINSANGSSGAMEEMTNSDNNIVKRDNNNNELMYPVCNNTTLTTTTLSTSSKRIITTTDTGINMHPTTTTVDQYIEQQFIPGTGNSMVDATTNALQGKTTPEKLP